MLRSRVAVPVTSVIETVSALVQASRAAVTLVDDTGAVGLSSLR